MKTTKGFLVVASAILLLTGCGKTAETKTAAKTVEFEPIVVTNLDFKAANEAISSIPEVIQEATDEVIEETTEKSDDIIVEIPVEDVNTDDASNADSNDVSGISKETSSTSTARTPEQILADELVAKTNEYRKSLGLNQLTVDTQLVDAAQVRALELPERWSHTRPNGTQWWTVNDAIMFGENLSKGYPTSDSIIQAWKDSETHNANLVQEKFNTIGIYVYIDDNGVTWVAQEFGY